MVYVVEESVYGFGYRELNQQLARENGELRQQLAQAVQENSNLRQEVHRRDVQILDLEHKVNDLASFQTKLNAIKTIILDDAIKSSSPIKALPSTVPTDISGTISSNSHALTTITRNTISPQTEDSQITPTDHSQETSSDDSLPTPTNSPTKEAATTTNNTTFEANVLNTIVEENDSLEPHNVSSVPPLTAVPERTMHTPSIWNCLDPLDDMYQSTPNRPSATKEQTNDENQEIPVERPRRGRGRKIQAESRAKREVRFDQEREIEEPPRETRYNLRKRSKT